MDIYTAQEMAYKNGYEKGYNIGYENGKKDAVIHAKLIWTEDGSEEWQRYFVCSKCGEHLFYKPNYCDNCGAMFDYE